MKEMSLFGAGGCANVGGDGPEIRDDGVYFAFGGFRRRNTAETEDVMSAVGKGARQGSARRWAYTATARDMYAIHNSKLNSTLRICVF